MKNKFLSIAAVIFLLAAFVSCSGGDSDITDATTATAAESTSESQRETEEVTTIPDQDIDENQGDWM